MPEPQHESCARKFAEVMERLEALELGLAERHLQVMEVVEKVTERLTERVRKRTKKSDENGDELDRIIAIRKGHAWPT